MKIFCSLSDVSGHVGAANSRQRLLAEQCGIQIVKGYTKTSKGPVFGYATEQDRDRMYTALGWVDIANSDGEPAIAMSKWIRKSIKTV